MRWLWASIGFVFLAAGAIGIFVPLWPTTIFWILAVFCLSESHPKVRDWIYARPGIGATIEGLIERGELSLSSKVAAIIGICCAGLLSSYFLRSSPLILGLLWLILASVCAFVASRKTQKPG